MRVNDHLKCLNFPCTDINPKNYTIPYVDVRPQDVTIMMISESAPHNPDDYYYAEGIPLFAQTTIQAFKDAGANPASIQDILDMGVFLTTAIKCGKTVYDVKSETIKNCSTLLVEELSLFPNVKVLLLMGDVAIKAINHVSQKTGKGRVIPAGSTYKIRHQVYHYGNIRAIPSYLQAGPSFFIEKSKRRMIAEDIRTALDLVK